MAVTDTAITDWKDDFEESDTNLPRDTDVIGGTLGEEVRNLKAVFRSEAENKAWLNLGWVPTSVTPNGGDASYPAITVWVFPVTVADAREIAIMRITSTANGVLYHRGVVSANDGANITIKTVPCVEYVGDDTLTKVDKSTWTISGDQTAVYIAGQRLLFVGRDTAEALHWVKEISSVAYDSGANLTTISMTNDGSDPPATYNFYRPQKQPVDADDVTKIEILADSPVPWLTATPHTQQGATVEEKDTDQAITYPNAEPNTTYEVKATVVDSTNGTATEEEKVQGNTLLTSGLTTSGANVVFPLDPSLDGRLVNFDYIVVRRQTT